MNCDDLDLLNRMTEQLLELYRSSSSQPESIQSEDQEYDEESAVNEWYDELPEDYIDETVEYLQDLDIDPEQAQAMDALSYTYDADSVQRAILAAGQGVYEGNMSMADAIIEITDTYGEPAAFAAYVELHSLLNNG